MNTPTESPMPASDSGLPSSAVTNDEAFARLRYVIENRQASGCLCGPTGAGKTRLLGRLAEWINRSQRRTVLLDCSGTKPDQFTVDLADQMRFWPKTDADSFEYWRYVEDELAGRQSAKIETVFLLDHLDGSPNGSEFLRRVTGFRDRFCDSHITVVAAMRPMSSSRRLPPSLHPGLRINLQTPERQ